MICALILSHLSLFPHHGVEIAQTLVDVTQGMNAHDVIHVTGIPRDRLFSIRQAVNLIPGVAAASMEFDDHSGTLRIVKFK